jgi:hypothetical protein
MKKTFDDYYNDPDIVNEMPAMREIHAIRLMIHDETKGMTAEEHTAYFNGSAARVLGKETATKLMAKSPYATTRQAGKGI